MSILLLILIILPFFGGILCLFFNQYHIQLSRYIAIITTFMIFLITLILLVTINKGLLVIHSSQYKWNIEYNSSWIPIFGINFHLALDGLSLLMLLLTSILGSLSILCSWNKIKYKVGFFYLNLLWVLGSVIGIFLSIDLFLFFCFWELMIFPMYFLIAIWGYKNNSLIQDYRRILAANKYFIYSQISSLILIFSILNLVILNYISNGFLTFDYNLLCKNSIDIVFETFIMLGFFLSFIIKVPVFPFNSWLSSFHSYSPVTGSVDLSGILTKTAIYALIRFNIVLFPRSSEIFSSFLVWFGLVSIFYGAIVSFSQTNIKRLIAYSSVSHMGFIVVAIYSATNQIAYQGIIIQIISYSLSTAALVVLSGQIFDYTQTFDMRKMGGLNFKLKWIPGFFLFFSMANLGIPGSGNFVGEFLIFIGCFIFRPIVISIILLSLILSALYSLRMIRQIFFGPYFHKSYYSVNNHSLKTHELFILSIFFILIILIGVYPNIIVNFSYSSINNIYVAFSNFILTKRL